jgi:tetratricopeptide (TPR) repeat protein
MHTPILPRVSAGLLVVVSMVALAGCEGWNRKHDYNVVDVTPPEDEFEYVRTTGADLPNFADLVEEMMESRQNYLGHLEELEREYLKAGNSVKSSWARRQKQLTEEVNVYPYLQAGPIEHRAEVAPVESIPEADAVFDEAVSILKEVSAVPLAGALPHNKKKSRIALDMFRRILRDYPKSDKVDDCAFYCAEIYKEYLREDDPDDELSVRYYKWAAALDPTTPHPARFQAAVVYDFRRHDRARAVELYHQVLELEENANESNMRFSASRIEQLTDEEFSHVRPDPPRTAAIPEDAAPARPARYSDRDQSPPSETPREP